MKAKISYAVDSSPHPFDAKRRAEGEMAWCLIRKIEDELGTVVLVEAIAIFNLRAEAELFMEHLWLGNDPPIRVPDDFVADWTAQRERRKP